MRKSWKISEKLPVPREERLEVTEFRLLPNDPDGVWAGKPTHPYQIPYVSTPILPVEQSEVPKKRPKYMNSQSSESRGYRVAKIFNLISKKI